ncbi:MAG: hypothetical protein ABFQ95_01990 [Pseudomonadota bacterium]
MSFQISFFRFVFVGAIYFFLMLETGRTTSTNDDCEMQIPSNPRVFLTEVYNYMQHQKPLSKGPEFFIQMGIVTLLNPDCVNSDWKCRQLSRPRLLRQYVQFCRNMGAHYLERFCYPQGIYVDRRRLFKLLVYDLSRLNITDGVQNYSDQTMLETFIALTLWHPDILGYMEVTSLDLEFEALLVATPKIAALINSGYTTLSCWFLLQHIERLDYCSQSYYLDTIKPYFIDSKTPYENLIVLKHKGLIEPIRLTETDTVLSVLYRAMLKKKGKKPKDCLVIKEIANYERSTSLPNRQSTSFRRRRGRSVSLPVTIVMGWA